MKGFFGIYFHGRGFIRIYQGLFTNITSINYYDTLIGFISMGILYFLRKLKEYDWCEGEDKEARRAKILKKTKWLLSISANCIVMLAMSLVPLFLLPTGLTLTGQVEGGLPTWQLPVPPKLQGSPIDRRPESGSLRPRLSQNGLCCNCLV